MISRRRSRQILQVKQLSPIYQLLRYNGTELVDASQTIADLGIVEHEEIWCEVLEDQDDEMLGGRAAEGFGGTALVGNIACPTCTLLNQGSALACDACGTVSQERRPPELISRSSRLDEALTCARR